MANITPKSNGTYLIRISCGSDAAGKPISKSKIFKPSKPNLSYQKLNKEIDTFIKAFEEEIELYGIQLRPDRIRFAEFCEKYLEVKKSTLSPTTYPFYESVVKEMLIPMFGIMRMRDIRTHHIQQFIQYLYNRIEKKLSPNTVRFYRSIAEQFIVPSYGNLRLSDITIKHQQAFVEYLSSPGARADENDVEPLSAATVKRYATVFSSVMTEACKMGFIDENKLKYGSVEYPKIVKKPIEVYNDDEARQFFEALQNESPKIKVMLLCALLLGLRRGEIVALKWSDINFRTHSLSVNKSVYKEKGAPQQLKPPKSQTSIRTVYFSDVLLGALEEWKTAQLAERESAGFDWKEQDFIFTNEVGDMISLYTPSRICSKFEEKNGLHHLKFHGLRHTCGSLMASNGVDPETVKTVLGHDSIETTNLYIHPYEKNMRKAAEILGNIVTK